MKLAELQHNFANSLRYQSEAINCDIATDHFDASSRLQIYRNNFILSLSDVLKATYSNTQLLVGDDCFKQLTRQYILTHPPRCGDVNEYGDHFWSIFSHFPQVINATPYLIDMAKLEWQVERLSTIAPQLDVTAIPLTQLHTVSEKQHPYICLVSHHNLHSYSSSFAIFDLIEAIKSQQFEQLNINIPQQGVLIASPTGRYSAHTLSNEATLLLQAIEKEKSLSKIQPEWLNALPELANLGVLAGFKIKETEEEDI